MLPKKKELFKLFKTSTPSLNKIAKLSKANYYSNFFEENKKKLNNVRLAIKEIININEKAPQKIQNINNNWKLIINHKNVANTFNNLFVDKSKQIGSTIAKKHKKHQDCLLNPVVSTFHLDLTNTEEVQSYTNIYKNNKSTGHSIIPNKRFKQFKKPPSEPLTLLINLTFSEANSQQFLK